MHCYHCTSAKLFWCVTLWHSPAVFSLSNYALLPLHFSKVILVCHAVTLTSSIFSVKLCIVTTALQQSYFGVSRCDTHQQYFLCQIMHCYHCTSAKLFWCVTLWHSPAVFSLSNYALLPLHFSKVILVCHAVTLTSSIFSVKLCIVTTALQQSYFGVSRCDTHQQYFLCQIMHCYHCTSAKLFWCVTLWHSPAVFSLSNYALLPLHFSKVILVCHAVTLTSSIFSVKLCIVTTALQQSYFGVSRCDTHQQYFLCQIMHCYHCLSAKLFWCVTLWHSPAVFSLSNYALLPLHFSKVILVCHAVTLTSSIFSVKLCIVTTALQQSYFGVSRCDTHQQYFLCQIMHCYHCTSAKLFWCVTLWHSPAVFSLSNYALLPLHFSKVILVCHAVTLTSSIFSVKLCIVTTALQQSYFGVSRCDTHQQYFLCQISGNNA